MEQYVRTRPRIDDKRFVIPANQIAASNWSHRGSKGFFDRLPWAPRKENFSTMRYTNDLKTLTPKAGPLGDGKTCC